MYDLMGISCISLLIVGVMIVLIWKLKEKGVAIGIIGLIVLAAILVLGTAK